MGRLKDAESGRDTRRDKGTGREHEPVSEVECGGETRAVTRVAVRRTTETISA